MIRHPTTQGSLRMCYGCSPRAINTGQAFTLHLSRPQYTATTQISRSPGACTVYHTASRSATTSHGFLCYAADTVNGHPRRYLWVCVTLPLAYSIYQRSLYITRTCRHTNHRFTQNQVSTFTKDYARCTFHAQLTCMSAFKV